MTRAREMKDEGLYMGKLDHGADLLEALAAFCRDKEIRLGWVSAIGAVQRARISFYDQGTQQYQDVDLHQPMEILNLTGNVSLRDGAPIVHAHVTLGDHLGRATGGHLAKGTVVFACEFTVRAFSSEDLVRGHDAVTGLPLWEMDG